jgi:hypothetical protein
MKRVLLFLAAAALIAIVPGAVTGASDEVFTGTFSGAQEVPPVTTSAGGTVYVFINPTGTEIKYAVSYTGLSGPLVAAHIHAGASGVNGQIMLPLTPGPSTMFGSLTQANFQSTSAATTWAAALNLIRTGRAYVNLHTAAHPQGEIRAQLKAAASAATPTPAPTRTPSPTATPRPTPRATVAATAAATPRRTPTPTHHSLPPTSTDPLVSRGTTFDLLSVLLVLGIGVVGGLVATAKVKPKQGTPPED